MGRWLFAGHAAREPEALRDLFAVQAAERGVSRFMVTGPATDPELVDIWFRLAFGCQAVWAVRECAAGTSAVQQHDPPGDPDDIEALDRLRGDPLWPPGCAELFRVVDPARDELRTEFRTPGDESYLPFVASDGRRLVMLALYRRPEGGLRVPAHNIDLAFAATRDDVRGKRRLALTNLRSAGRTARFRSMTVDWRAVNLLSSRFWPRGFGPSTSASIARALMPSARRSRSSACLGRARGRARAGVTTSSCTASTRAPRGLTSAAGVASGRLVHVAAATVGSR